MCVCGFYFVRTLHICRHAHAIQEIEKTHKMHANVIMCVLFVKNVCVCVCVDVICTLYKHEDRHTRHMKSTNALVCLLFVKNVCVCVDVILYALYTHADMHTTRMKSKKHTRSMKMQCKKHTRSLEVTCTG